MFCRIMICCVLLVAASVPDNAIAAEPPIYREPRADGAPRYERRRWDRDQWEWRRYPRRSTRPSWPQYREQFRPGDKRGNRLRRWPDPRFPMTFWVHLSAGPSAAALEKEPGQEI